MTRFSKVPPLYGLSATCGLHVLKQKWGKQKTHLGDQCQELLKPGHLDVAIKATRDDYQARANPFLNSEGAGAMPWREMDPSMKERILEGQILEHCCGSAPGLWKKLVARQVPLFARQAKRDWGYVDLLGIELSAPVIIELKADESKETPLRAVLEVVSYAIALRKNFEYLRAEFKAYSPCKRDDPFPCVVLAPRDYWDSWGPRGGEGGPVSLGSREVFRELCDALAKPGYPIRFGCAEGVSDRLTARAVDPQEVSW